MAIKAKVEGWHTETDMNTQKYIVGGLALGVLAAIWWFFHCQRRRAIAEEATVSPAPGVVIPWEKITRIDNTRWKGVPFLTIALLATLKSIPDELYEAGSIDGAGRWKNFRSITLPLMRPTLGAMCVVLGVQAFYSFDLVWILTQGGPGNSSMILGIQLFQTFFTQASPGQAAALGTIMLLLAVVLLVPVLRATSRRSS